MISHLTLHHLTLHHLMISCNHYPIKPLGLDDFQTEWLHQLLILCIWNSGYFGNLKIIDYVASPNYKY